MIAQRLVLPLAIFRSIAPISGFFATFPAKAFQVRSTSTARSAASTGEVAMVEVQTGDAIADVVLKELKTGDDKPQDVKLRELIQGKKVVIFGVPGAFTPGCSKSHLPSFMDAQKDLKEKEVDLTICVATNDPYVMEAWGRTSGGADAGIRFLSDANGELTRALGLAMESPVMLRMKRFSLLVDDGTVKQYFSSAKESSDTWAPAVLSSL